MSLIYDLETILKENEEGILSDDQALDELRHLVEDYDKAEQVAGDIQQKEFYAEKDR